MFDLGGLGLGNWELLRAWCLVHAALLYYIVEASKLEHGFRRISARIPYTLP